MSEASEPTSSAGPSPSTSSEDAPPPSKSRTAVLFLAAVVLLVSAVVVYLVAQQVSAGRHHERHPAVDFTARTLEGGSVTLSALKGHVVLLDFWATWCPPCREEMPNLARVTAEYEAQGVQFIAANRIQSDSPRSVSAFMSRIQRPGNMQVALVPDEVFEQYNVEALPTLFIIGRDGQVLDSHRGAYDSARIRMWVEEALREK